MKYLSTHFTHDELSCDCCNRTALDNGVMTETEFKNFLKELEKLRSAVNEPMIITSAYRCQRHNAEVGSKPTSRHTAVGDAVDVYCSDELALKLVSNAYRLGWKGIGVNQNGNGRYIHLDRRDNPTMWSY